MFFLAVFFLVSLTGFGQTKYWVFFTDKPHAKTSLEKVSTHFTPEALQFREQHHIAFDHRDVRVNQDYKKQVQSLATDYHRSSRWLNALVVTLTTQEQVQAISSLSFVKEVRPIQLLRTEKRLSANKLVLTLESVYGISSGFYGDGAPQLELYNLIPLHEQGFWGNEIRIAVLDAGFFGVNDMEAFAHLFDQNRIIATHDFVEGDSDVYSHHTHGTVVLSTMAANIPETMVGAAPKAEYLLCRTEDGSSETLIEEDNWVAAAEWCDSIGVHIINSSLGYTTFDDSTQNHTYADMDGNTTIITRGADIAASKGILVVNSAGNSGSSSWRYIGAPADGDSVLAVGAVDENGDEASFSSYGPSADGRVKPNVCAVGELATVVGTTDNTFQANGTSFASPLLAGAAACLWNMYPTATNMQLFDVIQRSGDRYFTPDDRCGYGIPDFQKAADSLLLSVPKRNYEPFKVFPNPVQNTLFLTFNFSKAEELELYFYSVEGKLINTFSQQASSGFQTIQFSLSSLPQGIYTLRVETSDAVFTQQVVKVQQPE